jgi:hypothetical protein
LWEPSKEFRYAWITGGVRGVNLEMKEEDMSGSSKYEEE